MNETVYENVVVHVFWGADYELNFNFPNQKCSWKTVSSVLISATNGKYRMIPTVPLKQFLRLQGNFKLHKLDKSFHQQTTPNCKATRRFYFLL